MSFGGLYYPAAYTPGFGSKPRLQSMHPFSNLAAAGSHLHNQWSGDNGHSGYGLENSDYDYHSGPSVHVPSGGSYSYHATAGSGYGPPAAPAVHHPPPKPVAHNPMDGKKGGLFSGGGGGKHGSSAMSALTLLSFLFFINLLQGCIKDHMDAMNPTVMVMTTNIIRNPFNKMGELNSREQSSANSANIVVHPNDLIQAAAAQSSSVVEATRPSISLQSYDNNKPITFNMPYDMVANQAPVSYKPYSPEPEVPISYPRPLYDLHKPDANDYKTQIQQTSSSYDNQTLAAAAQQPPPYKLTPIEQHYSFHHTEYNAQPISSQLPTTANIPFYEHQQPLPDDTYNNNYGRPQQNYDFAQNYEISNQQQNPYLATSSLNNKDQPWSTNSQTSSVISGPYRRASIIAVSPKTKWISVPAKIIDRTSFDTPVDEIADPFEHHDDRDVFHSRFN